MPRSVLVLLAALATPALAAEPFRPLPRLSDAEVKRRAAASADSSASQEAAPPAAAAPLVPPGPAAPAGPTAAPPTARPPTPPPAPPGRWVWTGSGWLWATGAPAASPGYAHGPYARPPGWVGVAAAPWPPFWRPWPFGVRLVVPLHPSPHLGFGHFPRARWGWRRW